MPGAAARRYARDMPENSELQKPASADSPTPTPAMDAQLTTWLASSSGSMIDHWSFVSGKTSPGALEVESDAGEVVADRAQDAADGA